MCTVQCHCAAVSGTNALAPVVVRLPLYSTALYAVACTALRCTYRLHKRERGEEGCCALPSPAAAARGRGEGPVARLLRERSQVGVGHASNRWTGVAHYCSLVLFRHGHGLYETGRVQPYGTAGECWMDSSNARADGAGSGIKDVIQTAPSLLRNRVPSIADTVPDARTLHNSRVVLMNHTQIVMLLTGHAHAR